jgi:hypothetical protein
MMTAGWQENMSFSERDMSSEEQRKGKIFSRKGAHVPNRL